MKTTSPIKPKKHKVDDIDPEEKALLTALADICIDMYLKMTPEERKKFIKKPLDNAPKG